MVTNYILGRLKAREAASTLRNLEFRKAEIDAVANLLPEAQKIVKQTEGTQDQHAPRRLLLFSIGSLGNAGVHRNRAAQSQGAFKDPQLRPEVAGRCGWFRRRAELDALGVARGPKFDKIIEQLFELQLRGRARTPEDRTKALRNLAGIREESW